VASTPDLQQLLADVDALGNLHRLRIVAALQDGRQYVSELARQIGISQPSVSNWNKVPAERVLIVEAATGIDRKILRPDLYQSSEETPHADDDVAAARAQEYALLATLLARAPDAKLLAKLATMRGDASPLGIAHAALAQRPAVERACFLWQDRYVLGPEDADDEDPAFDHGHGRDSVCDAAGGLPARRVRQHRDLGQYDRRHRCTRPPRARGERAVRRS